MSLFLKIFLWFWGAMALLGLSFFALQVTVQDDLVLPPRQGFVADALASYGKRAVEIYESKGTPELEKYLQRVQNRTHVKVYLFDPQSQELGQKRAAGEVMALAERAAQSAKSGQMEAQFQISVLRISAAQPIRSPKGTYVLAGAMWRGLITATRTDPRHRLLRVFTLLCVAGLVCFGLARTLAAPVSRLRAATQKLASGDLSARVAAGGSRRDELAGLARDFNAMAARLELSQGAQKRLLGDVSHELRSPLARLNLALELAKRGQNGALERIERESARLETLVGELLTISRLESGLEGAQVVDLGEIAREVAADADFEAQNAGRGVKIEFSEPKDKCEVRGDAELLRRALENVARNAVQHTRENSVVQLRLERAGLASSSNHSQRNRLEEDARPALERIRWTAHDFGSGVPENELPLIFEPFYRADAARERENSQSGVGLGLAIARRAVEAHGGKIGAKNAQNGGLEVEISLPAVK